MKEDYVSFKIAKLLKRKGFDWTCSVAYDLERPKACEINKYYTNFGDSNHNKWSDLVSAPTLQTAMKWLREVKKLIITMDYDEYELSNNKKTAGYSYAIQKPSNPSEFFKIGKAIYDTYEAACEAAIKDCLTNLI